MWSKEMVRLLCSTTSGPFEGDQLQYGNLPEELLCRVLGVVALLTKTPKQDISLQNPQTLSTQTL